MGGHTVPAGGGRSVLVRAGHEGECVQLAILSVNGKIIEDATLDSGQLPALVVALQRSQEQAELDLMGALARRQREAKQSYRDALARNPWLTEERRAREAKGLR
jgi:hypothetical protein